MTPFLDALTRRLAQDEPTLPQDHRHAAVALILREEATGPEVLLMQRALREGDRWSGQISLPGGHREDTDSDLTATAVRETHEEVGVGLSRDQGRLGHLDPVQARARGRRLPMTIAPIVFAWPESGRIALGPEADDAFWLPLNSVIQGELDAEYEYPHDGVTLRLPSWRYEERTVWGLTHMILGTFLDSSGLRRDLT